MNPSTEHYSASDYVKSITSGKEVERSETRACLPFHISPHPAILDPETGEIGSPTVTFYENASRVKVTIPAETHERKPGKRGFVDPTFSKAARRRMMQENAKIERPTEQNAPIFVTLTAPGKEELWINTTPDDWHRYLDNFGKRLLRKFPGAGVEWRLEPQERGAPHFHLLVWGVWPHGRVTRQLKPAWRELLEWVSVAWWEVWGSGDEDHLKAGTQVQRVNSYRHMLWYISKYLAKMGTEWKHHKGSVGRLWGFIGRDNIPWGKEINLAIDRAEAVKIVRLIRKGYLNIKGRVFYAISVMCDANEFIKAMVRIGWIPEFEPP